jgi:hypothetical protein
VQPMRRKVADRAWWTEVRHAVAASSGRQPSSGLPSAARSDAISVTARPT